MNVPLFKIETLQKGDTFIWGKFKDLSNILAFPEVVSFEGVQVLLSTPTIMIVDRAFNTKDNNILCSYASNPRAAYVPLSPNRNALCLKIFPRNGKEFI